MAVDLGEGRGKVRPTMNVTPLVDVVLVLLIIFMVVTPLLTRQVWLRVPAKDDPSAGPPPADAPPPLVLTLGRDATLRLNQEALTEAELPAKLKAVLAGRAAPIIFFDAEDDVPYGEAMRVLDRARDAAAGTLAVMTERAEP